MWNKIKLILWLVILLAVAYFVSMNTTPKISVNILPTFKTPEIPLAIVIIVSIIIGAVLILLFTITDWIAYKIDKIKLSRNIKHLENELEKCRFQINQKEDQIKKLEEEIQILKNEKNITVKQEEEEGGTL
ncbi:lipopolysaccharide assembly protein LapA domain-containing protein [Persephonella sp.]|uniref:lipopolysaccharide assembly protein LapA domain-containing protein n=1 Tax=Persephonella sp. TaxID=2060922 RepID=UPI0025FD0F51|nr:lipopolysaccharide assembly protein LapA domain-containing protein [Persephonella sp.]